MGVFEGAIGRFAWRCGMKAAWLLALWAAAGGWAGPAVAAGPGPESRRPRVLFWRDAAVARLPDARNVPAGKVWAGAVRCGFPAAAVASERLAGADVWTDAECLVLPYGPAYPAAAAVRIADFLRAKRSLLLVGPSPLTLPLFEMPGGGWAAWNACGRRGVSIPGRSNWSLSNAAPGEALAMRPAGPERAGAEFSVEALEHFAYRGLRLPPLDADLEILVFEARGDARTRRLCLELREKDGSRWKYVVPLSPVWRRYAVHVAVFSSYATPGRGGVGDFFRTASASSLFVGFTAAMAGRGSHRFWVRSLAFRQARVRGGRLARTRRFPPGPCDVRKWFGREIRGYRFLPAPLVSGNACGRRGGAGGVSGPEPACTGADSAGGGGRPRRAWWKQRLGGPDFLGVSGPGPGNGRERPGSRSGGRVFLVLNGPYSGAVVGWAPLPRTADGGGAGFESAVGWAVGACTRAVWAWGLAPEFRVRGGAVGFLAAVNVWNRADIPVPLEVRTGVRPEHGEWLRAPVRTVVLGPGAHRRLAWPAQRGTVSAGAGFDLECGLRLRGGRRAPRLRLFVPAAAAGRGSRRVFRDAGDRGVLGFQYHPRAALARLAGYLAARAGANAGQLSGVSFIDSRGARTLAAAAEIFGRSDYRELALEWARGMVRRQRKDGGFRMGYGISTKGEECYVADGGEIALGIACLAPCAAGAEQRALLASLQRYMTFRESFRAPSGGIGVGWCALDYGKRPVKPLAKVTRILAPELNPYTVGCSLGAAYAYAHLTGSEAEYRKAAADAAWLMRRTHRPSGAAAESFMFAHAFAPAPEIRRKYALYLKQHFILPMEGLSSEWWLRSGGRAALDLMVLVYCRDNIEAAAPVRVQILRAATRMFGREGPESMDVLIAGRRPLEHDEWIYLCYGGLGLCAVVDPGVLPRPAAEGGR